MKFRLNYALFYLGLSKGNLCQIVLSRIVSIWNVLRIDFGDWLAESWWRTPDLTDVLVDIAVLEAHLCFSHEITPLILARSLEKGVIILALDLLVRSRVILQSTSWKAFFPGRLLRNSPILLGFCGALLRKEHIRIRDVSCIAALLVPSYDELLVIYPLGPDGLI